MVSAQFPGFGCRALFKGGNVIFDICSNLVACCAHGDETDTDKSVQLLTGGELKNVLTFAWNGNKTFPCMFTFFVTHSILKLLGDVNWIHLHPLVCVCVSIFLFIRACIFLAAEPVYCSNSRGILHLMKSHWFQICLWLLFHFVTRNSTLMNEKSTVPFWVVMHTISSTSPITSSLTINVSLTVSPRLLSLQGEGWLSGIVIRWVAFPFLFLLQWNPSFNPFCAKYFWVSRFP